MSAVGRRRGELAAIVPAPSGAGKSGKSLTTAFITHAVKHRWGNKYQSRGLNTLFSEETAKTVSEQRHEEEHYNDDNRDGEPEWHIRKSALTVKIFRCSREQKP